MNDPISNDTNINSSDLLNDLLSGKGLDGTSTGGSEDKAKLAQVFEDLLKILEAEKGSSSGNATPSPASAEPASSSPSIDSNPVSKIPTSSQPSQSVNSSPSASTPDHSGEGVTAGSGPNSTTIKNTSSHEEKIGQFLNGGSTTQPDAEITLKPGETGTLKYQNGQGGFDAEADSSGKYQSTASRLEFYADNKGVNNDDVSYIDGRNASIKVSDDQGKQLGDDKSIAGNAPSDAITHDSGGRATVTGWYDGSTDAMKAGGAFMQSQLGTGNAYLHPDDDRNGAGSNPMTLAQDPSQKYTAEFGDA
ncbi:hypothetical protein ABUE34_11765 [Kozakia baliensis]|uniref:hypothetical protein n=1 Tax=Kozakia baliensis TaxID=153496 RepID=UPI00345BC8D8